MTALRMRTMHSHSIRGGSTDGDNIGNNADTDDDGVEDANDAFPSIQRRL